MKNILAIFIISVQSALALLGQTPAKACPLAVYTTTIPLRTAFASVEWSQDAHRNEAPSKPEIFAPGKISKPGRLECGIGFMPNSRECYVAVHEPRWKNYGIYRSDCKDGQWSDLEPASFSTDRSIGAWPSPDGKEIYYVARGARKAPSNLWMCQRQGGGWSEPVKMPEPANSSSNEFSAHMTPSGTLYTCSWRDSGLGECDLWSIRDGKAVNYTHLNTPSSDCGPVTDANESFMIFQSNCPGGYGSMDLYISFRKANGRWGPKHNLGPLINTPDVEGGPCLSPDGKILYYGHGDNVKEKDIYWVKMDAVLAAVSSSAAIDGIEPSCTLSLPVAHATTRVCACSAATTPTVGPQHGTCILGGSGGEPEMKQRFLELAGGAEAQIVVIPTASGGEGEHLGRGIAQQFEGQGVSKVSILHTRDPTLANTDAFIEPLKTATGVWFGGGRQWRLVDAYRGTKTLEAIWAVLERGGVVAGGSAGATIQGSFLARGDTSGNQIMMGDHQEGFAFVKDVAVDQHLLARNRQFDLIEIVQAHPELLGIGLDEGAAIVVQGNEFEVIGDSYVVIYDYTKTIHGFGPFYFLQPGDKYNLATRKAQHKRSGETAAMKLLDKPWPKFPEKETP